MHWSFGPWMRTCLSTVVAWLLPVALAFSSRTEVATCPPFSIGWRATAPDRRGTIAALGRGKWSVVMLIVLVLLSIAKHRWHSVLRVATSTVPFAPHSCPLSRFDRRVVNGHNTYSTRFHLSIWWSEGPIILDTRKT